MVQIVTSVVPIRAVITTDLKRARRSLVKAMFPGQGNDLASAHRRRSTSRRSPALTVSVLANLTRLFCSKHPDGGDRCRG